MESVTKQTAYAQRVGTIAEHDAERRQDHDVNLGMTEEPENMLE